MAKVVVVDDEKHLIAALEAILSIRGHDVRAAESGEEALVLVEEDPPDLIIADVVMPGMDGLEFEQAVRGQEKLADLPFLFISANTSLELENKIAALDNAIFLHKPFDVEDLFETMNAILAE